MSQPLIDRTESSSANAPTAPLPARLIREAWGCLNRNTQHWDTRRYGTGSGSDRAPSERALSMAPGRYRSRYRTNVACFDLATRALQSLLVCLGLTCATAVAAFAQQAQIVKSANPVVCDGKNHQLRLVAAEAPINGDNAKALGVVLTPDNTASSKVFCLYWIDATSASPTHRDDAKGVLGNALVSYGGGRTIESRPKPAIEAFFAGAKCLPEDPQVTGVQDLIKIIDTAPANLREVASYLKNRGVGVDDGKVEDASAGNKTFFAGLQNDMGFAIAIRQYVSNVLAAEGRNTGAAGSKLSLEDEKKQLIAQITDLENEVRELLAEKNSIFGGAPIWFISIFFTTLVALLIVLSLAYYSYTVIGFAYYRYNKGWRLLKNGSSAEIENPDMDAEVPNGQLPRIMGIWREIVSQSNSNIDEIDQKHSGVWRDDEAKDQTKGPNELARTVLFKLEEEKLIHLNRRERVWGILKEKLGEDSGKPNSASQYKQCAKDWRGACINLHNQLYGQLTEFQGGLASPGVWTTDSSHAGPSLPGGTDMTLVAQNMPESLSILAKESAEVKAYVRGFDGKLEKCLEVSQNLQHIWRLWYGKKYHDGDRMDTFVEDVGVAISVFQSLERQVSKHQLSVTETKRYWEYVLEDLSYVRNHYLDTRQGESTLLHDITGKIRTRMGEDAAVVKKYGEIETSLRGYFRNNVEAPTAVEILIEDHFGVIEKLGMYHPDQSNFTGTIDAIATDYREVADQVNRALPGISGSMMVMVESLATEYLKLEPEARRALQLQAERDDLQRRLETAHSQLVASKELVEEIALQLNYKADHLKEDEQAVVLALSQLRKERKSSVYQQLRMGLSAALIALEKATRATGSAEQAEVIEALYLDKVRKGLKELLAEMEEYSGDRLWSVGLTAGFSQKWLHYLIRADLLLRTYYTGKRDFRLLREAVSMACSSTQAALYELNVDVIEIGLFEPLPQGIETEPVYPSLRSLPTVKDKVRRKLQSMDNGEVVVDVTSFPYRVSGEQRNPGRVSLVNPSAWLQN